MLWVKAQASVLPDPVIIRAWSCLLYFILYVYKAISCCLALAISLSYLQKTNYFWFILYFILSTLQLSPAHKLTVIKRAHWHVIIERIPPSVRQRQNKSWYYLSKTWSMLQNRSAEICRTHNRLKWNIHEQVYTISFHKPIIFHFSQSPANNIHKSTRQRYLYSNGY